MRLVELRPTSFQQTLPLAVMALGKEGEVCYHYRTVRDHGSFMDSRGLNIVLAGEEIAGGEEPDGLTIESLLAICEDHARNQELQDPRMQLIAMKLHAARRALALDESGGDTHSAVAGSDSNQSTVAHATATDKG